MRFSGFSVICTPWTQYIYTHTRTHVRNDSILIKWYTNYYLNGGIYFLSTSHSHSHFSEQIIFQENEERKNENEMNAD